MKLDAWLQTMRNQDGYCGPVSHWWESSLLYSGQMTDWRYEGIICGYLNLYARTQQAVWLDRAVTAGDDVIRAQLPSGMYRNSSFQQGPMEGGTPHEAAVDVGLLELARVLRKIDDSRWYRFFEAAERNLLKYQIDCLWNGHAFLDQPWNQTLVPNKNATTMEALLLYEELSGRSMEEYTLGAARLILSSQVKSRGPREGATIHLGTGKHHLAIGIYTARCASALVRLYRAYGDELYLLAAGRMGQFLERLIVDEGTLFGFYADDRLIAAPIWISPSGDIFRALADLLPHNLVSPDSLRQVMKAMLQGQLPSGGICTALGLGHKGMINPWRGLPDFRDVLPVVGWCDKTFRALTLMADESTSVNEKFKNVSIACAWKRRYCTFQEDRESLMLVDNHKKTPIYLWKKGAPFPEIFRL